MGGGENTVGKILIADDDKTCRDSIQKVFEKEGHTVQTAGDVDSALGVLAAGQFDLVVCDYRMPGKTGIDLLLELKRQHSPVPVLMISAFADAATQATAIDLGALGILKKPIRRKDLIDRASRIVGG
jgi:DNA-binding NtrC family response regulator